MHARFSSLFMAVTVGLAVLGTGACRRSADGQQRVADKATEEAEEKASQTTLTSAEIGAADGPNAPNEEAREAQERALRERAEAITALRNEQHEYRGKLQRALDGLDAQRREAKKRGHHHVTAVDGRREVLKHHLDALDRTADTEWASLKARIDRDLKVHGADDSEGK